MKNLFLYLRCEENFWQAQCLISMLEKYFYSTIFLNTPTLPNFAFYFSCFNDLKSYSWFSSWGWSTLEQQSRRKAHLLATLIIPCCCLASTHAAREKPDLEAICWEFQILSVPLFQSIRPEREWQSTSFSSVSVVLGFPPPPFFFPPSLSWRPISS